MKDRAEVVIVGAGIAGASLAYFLAEKGIGDVLVLEREEHAAYHATGRSAATLVELDPVGPVQRLKMLGGEFLRHPPAGFAENALLDQRGVLALYRDPEWSRLEQQVSHLQQQGMQIDLLSPRAASERLSGALREDAFAGAAFLGGDGFLDVHEILSSYVRHARRAGAEFHFSTEVTGIDVDAGVCRGVRTSRGSVRARLLVNAAGAWVDEIARRAGALPIEFRPMRRTIAILAPPRDLDVRHWPLVWSEAQHVYFRPESPGLLFCPMDETPMAPCDAVADDVRIAEGLERLRALAPQLVPQSLGRRWAGLRTFSPDRVPVVGEDPQLPGFFWLAGQGGCGIETSPILGQIAADLIADGKTERFDETLLTPRRF